MRKGKLFLTRISVVDQPHAAAYAPAAERPINFDALGLSVSDLTDANRAGLPKEVKGVVISSVSKNSLAEQSGLARGQVVLQVDRAPALSADVFRKAIEQSSPAKGAVLHVLRPNGDVDFVILKLQ